MNAVNLLPRILHSKAIQQTGIRLGHGENPGAKSSINILLHSDSTTDLAINFYIFIQSFSRKNVCKNQCDNVHMSHASNK